jgi:hypothetical protein
LLETKINADITRKIKKERNALELEAEKLRAQCDESGKLVKRLNFLIEIAKTSQKKETLCG